jgi:predicted  nucleic acid-binding Zn-ribbon protein
MSTGTITKLQNEIAGLQSALAERNREIADLKRKFSEANETSQKTINELRAVIEAARVAKLSETA